MSPEEHELQLRSHIRNLLFDYAKTHLTTDYIVWTEEAVSELLSPALTFVPITDSTSLALPEDPFDTLSRILGFSGLQPFDEKFTTDRDAIELIRKSLGLGGKAKTERCWDEKEECDFETSLYRPMSPILTTRAIRQTPQLGSLDKHPKSHSPQDLLKDLKPVTVELIEEPKPIKLEDALNLRPIIDSSTHSEMLKLYKSVPGLIPSQKFTGRFHVNAFLRSDSPLPVIPHTEFVPIFPRVPETSKSRNDSIPASFSELSLLIPVIEDVDPDEKDLYKQHMIVVDGWQTIAPSSPSDLGSPSITSATAEVDQLFLVSSPGTQAPLIQELVDSKIEETLIPRSQRIGGSTKTVKHIGDGQSLGSFLSPFVSKPMLQEGTSPHPGMVTPPPSSPRSAPGLSVLGQPASPIDEAIITEKAIPETGDESVDLDIEIGQLYSTFQTTNPLDIIMNEKLDGDDSLLMDVPSMAEPNNRPPSTTSLPTNLRELLTQDYGKSRADNCGTVSQVKGLKSLNMELSWRPLQFLEKMPTHEELAGVDGEFRDKRLALKAIDVDENKVAALLDHTTRIYSTTDEPRGWSTTLDDLHSVTYSNHQVDDFDVIFTRAERRRLAGESDQLTEDEEPIGPSGRLPISPKIHVADVQVTGSGSEQALGQDGVFFSSAVDDSAISLSHSQDIEDTDVRMHERQANHRLNWNKENIAPMVIPADNEESQSSILHDDVVDPLSAAVGDEPGHGTFMPLSFDSYADPSPIHRADRDPQDQPSEMVHTREQLPRRTRSPSGNPFIDQEPVDDALDASQHNSSRGTADMALINTSLAAPSLAGFLAFRNTLVEFSFPPADDSSVMDHAVDVDECVPDAIDHPGTGAIPETIFDRNTLILPSPWRVPLYPHFYLASLQVIQKRSIVRSLAHETSDVQLVERETLGGVDFILDPHTAVILSSLSDLPLQSETVLANISQQSWRFSRVLVIWEFFNHTTRDADPETPIYPPASVKAIKKLRRDLAIAEAFETKNVNTSIHFAFANDANAAAKFVRCFGDCAEVNDTTGGAIWGTRDWLDLEAQEDEQDLASIDGMNLFAACVILCQNSLQDFLDLTSEERLSQFGRLVGQERMQSFNAFLQQQYQTMRSE